MLQYSPRPVRHRDEEHVSQLLLAGPPQPPEVEEEGEGVALGSKLQRVVEAAGGGVRAAAEKEPVDRIGGGFYSLSLLLIICKQGKITAYAERAPPGAVVGGWREGIRILASGGRRGGGE